MLGSTENKPSLNFKFSIMVGIKYICVTQIAMHLECYPLTAVRPTVTIALHDLGAHRACCLEPILSIDVYHSLYSGDSLSQERGKNG